MSDALLLEILQELRNIRRDLARPHADGTSISRTDRTRLARLLPAIAGAFGSEPFSSRDLTESEAPGVRLVVQGLSAKQIGKLFARADGLPIDGLMVLRHGVEFQVTMWRVVAQ